MRRPTAQLVPAFCCLLAASLVRGDEPNNEKARAAAALEHGRAEVGKITIRAAGPGGEAFRLVSEPLLRWSNPIRGSLCGEVYIWTLKGRPEVVGSFLEWFQPIESREIELHSLSIGPLVAERPDHLDWTAPRAGVELKPIPGVPAPAETPAQRLRQMRELAKDFTARQISGTGVEYEMRLLQQPVYRYEGTEGDLIDGALFVFVHAGDPEVFLQVEARKARGSAEWQYALARFNSVFLAVRHKGRDLWTAEAIVPWSRVLERREPYTAIMLGPYRP
jgi:hypothetical protein